MVISNAIICDANKELRADVRVENGIVVEIGSDLEDEKILDAKGVYLLPKLIDLNIRVKDNTLNAKNIKKISDEALKGGVGHLVLTPDLTPAIDNEIVLEFAQNTLNSLEDIKIDFSINTLQDDGSLSNIAILLKKGAVAPYMSTIAKNNLAIKIAEYVQMYKITLFCKAEDNSLIHNGVMLDGDISSHLGLAGIPNLSEVLHVSRMIEIARFFKIKILFKSIASPRSISLINKAKEEGLDVSCEVSINHLLKSDESCLEFNTTAKLNPPLSSKEDLKYLQDALKNSKIDIITTLHQPSSPINKEVSFFDADYGSESLSYALPLYYTKLVKDGFISLSELVRLSVLNPAKAIGLDKGIIEVGKEFDCVLFDISKQIKVENKQSLFDGEYLDGAVIDIA